MNPGFVFFKQQKNTNFNKMIREQFENILQKHSGKAIVPVPEPGSPFEAEVDYLEKIAEQNDPFESEMMAALTTCLAMLAIWN